MGGNFKNVFLINFLAKSGNSKHFFHFFQGCDKLLISTDHKPLLGVLNDRSLDSIDNPRHIRLKKKTLGWMFRIIHIPGGSCLDRMHCH